MSLALPVFAILAAAAAPTPETRVILNLNPGWKFVKGDPRGAEAPAFDDRAWTTVSLPHTYNDVDTFDDWSLVGHRGEQAQWSGRTWYRKTFTLPASYGGRKVYVEIEGARQIAEVYLNGRLLGVDKTGFVPFGFDLTPHVRFGAPNVLAVMCDNRFLKDPLPAEVPAPAPTPSPGPAAGPDLNIAPPAGSRLADLIHKMSADIPEDVDKLAADQIPWNNPHWHPAHGGLYRNVKLHVTDKLHVTLPLFSGLGTVGPYAYATDITDESARVTVEVPIQNGRAAQTDVSLVTDIVDAEGKTVLTLKHKEPVAAGAQATFKVSGLLPSPRLWAPGHAHVYRVISTLNAAGRAIDRTEVPLGIRSVRWDTQAGFFINGQHLKLRGWGQKPTNEWPGLGAAQPDWMHHFTLQLVRDAGGNFVRWGHCPGGPASIASADRLGLVTLQPGLDGEADTHGAAWKVRAAAFRDLVVYYRNHPSILIWEGGNQKVSREHARELRGTMDTYDPHGGRAYAHRRADAITAEFMHVGIGTEGGREIKDLPVVEGEYDREEAPRRVWDDASPPTFGYHEAKGQTYQLTSEQFAVNQVAHYAKKLGAPDHAGGANWIFSDSTSGGRVGTEVARVSGEVDGVRLPKEAYFACRAMFSDAPQVHVIGHWNYPAGTKKNVYVVSNAEYVELFVNGRHLGRANPTDRYLFTFKDVAFEAGEIRVIAVAAGKTVATQVKATTGPAVGLRLTPITGPGGLQADGSDVVLLDVEAVDAQGRRVPTFQERVDFTLEGPGVWRGGYNSGKVGSINRTDLELEAGINRVAVRSTLKAGAITVRAASHALEPGRATVTSHPVRVQAGYMAQLPQLPAYPSAYAEEVKQLPLDSEKFPPIFRDLPGVAPPPGQYITTFSYSGPSAGARVESNAGVASRVYTDQSWTFDSLPETLRGADHVQVSEADRLYNAVDLMEIAVKAGTLVRVAHDDRLARPAWLTTQFRATTGKLLVQGHPMTLFERRADQAASLTLGANTESTSAAGHMYVVFVGPVAAGVK